VKPTILNIQEPFILESGIALPEVNIAYHTYGKLNATADNVIWVCHALTANSEVEDWWKGLFGQHKIFDPEKYFIVCVNNLGSPYGSTSPSSINKNTDQRYGLDFPFFTIRDQANFILLLKAHLKIETIHILMGGSGGGHIASEMAYTLQQKINTLILLCTCAKESPWSIGIHQAGRLALKADPSFAKNKENTGQKGLKAARALALPFYRTYASICKAQEESSEAVLQNFKAASYIEHQGNKLVNRFDAHCYYVLLNALDTHNLARNRTSMQDALKAIKVNTLCIGIDTDALIPIPEQQFLADHLPNATYKEVKSFYGHDGFLLEFEQIQSLIDDFLD